MIRLILDALRTSRGDALVKVAFAHLDRFEILRQELVKKAATNPAASNGISPGNALPPARSGFMPGGIQGGVFGGARPISSYIPPTSQAFQGNWAAVQAMEPDPYIGTVVPGSGGTAGGFGSPQDWEARQQRNKDSMMTLTGAPRYNSSGGPMMTSGSGTTQIFSPVLGSPDRKHPQGAPEWQETAQISGFHPADGGQRRELTTSGRGGGFSFTPTPKAMTTPFGGAGSTPTTPSATKPIAMGTGGKMPLQQELAQDRARQDAAAKSYHDASKLPPSTIPAPMSGSTKASSVRKTIFQSLFS